MGTAGLAVGAGLAVAVLVPLAVGATQAVGFAVTDGAAVVEGGGTGSMPISMSVVGIALALPLGKGKRTGTDGRAEGIDVGTVGGLPPASRLLACM